MWGGINDKKLPIIYESQHRIKVDFFELLVEGGAHSRKTILFVKLVLHYVYFKFGVKSNSGSELHSL